MFCSEPLDHVSYFWDVLKIRRHDLFEAVKMSCKFSSKGSISFVLKLEGQEDFLVFYATQEIDEVNC